MQADDEGHTRQRQLASQVLLSASGQDKDLAGTVSRLFTAQDIAKVIGGDALPVASDGEGSQSGSESDMEE